MKSVWIPAIAGAVALWTALPSYAEPGPIGRWLMSEPVSLWDWGLLEAGKEVDQAAEYVAGHFGQRAHGWVRYNWKNNEIDLRVTIRAYDGDISHEICNKVRRAFIGALAYTFSLVNEDLVRDLLRENIDSWFSHNGYRNAERDKELGEKMSRIIFVKVFLANNNGIITCRERIMVFDAPSKPGP